MEKNQIIILVGMMASGKSTIGQTIAKKLGWRFVDSDAWLVEKSGLSIAEIFATDGEAAFRKRETEALEELTGMARTVLATGGGAPTIKANWPLLARGLVVQLQVSVEEVLERTRNDTTRPLLMRGNPEERIRSLLTERSPIYDAVSDIRIDTRGKTPQRVVQEILDSTRVVAMISDDGFRS